MVETKVENLLTKAINKYAKKHGVPAQEIKLLVHTKTEDYIPLYSYEVDEQKQMDGERLVSLDFVQDIMDKKFTMSLYPNYAMQFFSGYLKTLSKTEEVSPYELFLKVGMNEDDSIKCEAYHLDKKIKTMTLAEVFNM